MAPRGEPKSFRRWLSALRNAARDRCRIVGFAVAVEIEVELDAGGDVRLEVGEEGRVIRRAQGDRSVGAGDAGVEVDSGEPRPHVEAHEHVPFARSEGERAVDGLEIERGCARAAR